jgi:hypothetical protein
MDSHGDLTRQTEPHFFYGKALKTQREFIHKMPGGRNKMARVPRLGLATF